MNNGFSKIRLTNKDLITSGVRLYVDGSGVLFQSETGVLAAVSDLQSTGSNLQNQITAVTSWTGISTGLYYPRSSNPSGYVTGAVVRPTETGSFITTAQTGAFYPTSNPSGYATTGFVTGASGALSDRLNTTGTTLLSLIQAASAGVSSLNGASGILALTGAGNVTVSIAGQTITVSGNTGIYSTFVTTGQTGSFGGGNTGQLTGVFYPLYQNPSGYLTGNRNLGLPSDGAYGGTNGAIAGVASGDSSENAFDKVEVILGKLAPAKPSNLSSATFSFSNTTYSAIEQGTSTTRSNVMNSFRPTGFATGFYDGDAGTLSDFINGNLTGLRILTTGLDTGIFTGLNIYQDADFWSGVAGRAGFWTYLNARVYPTGDLVSGLFTMSMSHSSTGPTQTLSGYCDAPVTPLVTVTSASTGVSVTRTIDGVKSMATNDPITVFFTLSNAVSAFYRSPIANVDSSESSSVNVNTTGTPLSGTTLFLSGTTLVETNKFITGWVPSVFGYNSAGSTSATATSGTNIRIDTVSSQPSTRRKAGSGQYPTIYGDTYDDTNLLTLNEELQLINGLIQYPPLINYANIIPTGPNYSNLNTGSFITGGSGYRWSNFNMGNITADSSITLTFNSTSNFGANTILNGVFLYVKVSGSTPSNGWVDGNAAYPGVGNPTNNGDPALVVGSSSSTVKVITFGTAALDGAVWARVGFPSGSNKSFASLSLS